MFLKFAIICITLNFVCGGNDIAEKPQIISVGYNRPSTRAYGRNIRKILDDLRDRMHMDMTDSMGIPRLDPLTIEHLKINEDDTDLGLDLTATNISAVGLQEFITTEADFELIGSRFKVGIRVPSITVTGNYNVSGNVGGLIPLHGKGKLNIILTNLIVNVNAKLSFLPTRVKTTLDLKFDNILVDLDGLMGGGELGEFFNELVNAIIPDIYDEYYPELKPIVEELVDNMASEMLKDSSLTDLLNLLIRGIKFPPIEPKP